jgi:2-methylcitrate dehydratase PrpD
MTPGEELANFSADIFPSLQLPTRLIDITHLHILDSLAAIISGSALDASKHGQQYVTGRPRSSEASICGTHFKTDVINATLANGMSAHADESDDSHEDSQTHPGCGVVPAVLSVGEWQGSSGEDIVKAVILGYEVTIRFGELRMWRPYTG